MVVPKKKRKQLIYGPCEVQERGHCASANEMRNHTPTPHPPQPLPPLHKNPLVVSPLFCCVSVLISIIFSHFRNRVLIRDQCNHNTGALPLDPGFLGDATEYSCVSEQHWLKNPGFYLYLSMKSPLRTCYSLSKSLHNKITDSVLIQ